MTEEPHFDVQCYALITKFSTWKCTIHMEHFMIDSKIIQEF